jgi:hypothetical protein
VPSTLMPEDHEKPVCCGGSSDLLENGSQAHTCHPSYLGGRDWKDHGFRSA